MKLTNTIFQIFFHNGYPQVPFNNSRSTDVEFTSFAHVGPGFLSATPLLPLRASNHRPQSVGRGYRSHGAGGFQSNEVHLPKKDH